MKPGDDYPDVAVPLAQAMVSVRVERGVPVCSKGVGVSVCAKQIAGVRAGLVHNNSSA